MNQTKDVTNDEKLNVDGEFELRVNAKRNVNGI